MSQWKLIPEIITEEMHVAAVKALMKSHGNDDFPKNVASALIAAAPQPAGEPVAEVLWFDPSLELFPKKTPHKIIDGYLSFMDTAEIGTKLFTYPPDAAKKIAELEKQRDELVKALRKISQMAYARSPEQKTANEALAIAKVNTGGI